MTEIGLEIQLTDDSDSFRKIRETLRRMGIANNKKTILYQSCHILNKRGKVYIVHFKEMLLLDGREVNITSEDIERRNDITKLLEEWGLCKIVDVKAAESERANRFRVISYRDATEGGWTLEHKYVVGKNKR